MDAPPDENTKDVSFGSEAETLLLVDDFRRMELASFELRPAVLDFFTVSAVQVKVVGYTSGVKHAASRDAELFVLSNVFSGVNTGIGRFIDNLEFTGVGVGTSKDSTSGLTGHSGMLEPKCLVARDKDRGLVGHAVY